MSKIEIRAAPPPRVWASKRPFEPQRHVGVLGRVLGRTRSTAHAGPSSAGAARLPDQRPRFGIGRIVQVLGRQMHPCRGATRDRADSGRSSYRTSGPSPPDPTLPQHHQIELDVLADLGDPSRPRTTGRSSPAYSGVRTFAGSHGHIPGLVRHDGERHAHDVGR